MAKYHIHPETGEPGVCKAKQGRCPFGSDQEHFDSKSEAREGYELLQEVFAKPVTHSEATLIALNSDLKWTGKSPRWLKATAKLQKSHFGTTPEILDVVPSRLGPLAVIWEQDSTASNDIHIQRDRGAELNRVTLNMLETGEEVGYLKMGYSDKRSLDRSFGTDYWRPFSWAEDAKGSAFGFTNYADTPKDTLRKVTPLREKSSAADILEAKKLLWARSHEAMRMTPPNFDTSQLMWGSLVNLTPEMAPKDEKRLDEEIHLLRNAVQEEMDLNVDWDSTPGIDYIKVDDRLRGSGLGHTLYVFGARMQAKEGRALRASGVQTPEAAKSWRRMLRTGLPVKVVSRKKSPTKNSELRESFELDFR